MKSSILIFICAFFLSFSSVLAQGYRSDRIGFGIGPSFLYGDNTGVMQDFKFKVLPVLSLDLQRELSEFFDIKGTVGWQMINSGNFYSQEAIDQIAEANLPHAFTGNVFFADAMPIYHFNPDRRGYMASPFKIYTGLGLGFFHSRRTDEYQTLNSPERRTVTRKASESGVYIPFRLGVYKELQTAANIGVEATIGYSPFGQIDGNDLKQKSIRADMLMQLQFYYRIHIGSYY
jgi:hypothetical protein